MEAITKEIMLRLPGDIKTLISYDHLFQTSAVSGQNRKEQRKVPEVKLENKLPPFYTKPIFKPRDYDPL